MTDLSPHIVKYLKENGINEETVEGLAETAVLYWQTINKWEEQQRRQDNNKENR